MHYPIQHPQGELVCVVQSEVFDVVVDLPLSSATLVQWAGVHLEASQHQQLWIPTGLAHGFVALTSSAEFLYKTTDARYSEQERGLYWNDPVVGIDWPIDFVPQLSAKDQSGCALRDAEVFS